MFIAEMTELDIYSEILGLLNSYRENYHYRWQDNECQLFFSSRTLLYYNLNSSM